MILNELVADLAGMQAERGALEAAADAASSGIDLMIVQAKNALAALQDQRNELRQADEIAMGARDIEIGTLKAHILEMWDGEKKTVRYEEGLLKMRTTTRTRITDPGLLLYILQSHLPMHIIVENYIQGFYIKPVKAFVEAHGIQDVATETIEKTTVILEENPWK